MGRQVWHFLHLKNYPIYKQLQLEEALLRADERNWCVINEGTPAAIVLGISGRPEQMLNAELLIQKPVPVIRRFSGGGTVYVDDHTHFITFIGNSEHLKVSACPQKVLQWTETLYKPLLQDWDFQVRENDYVLGNRKFGGNAQYMRKQRWLHHSSLLWDFNPLNMDYLKMPIKQPLYREQRHHTDFLCCLKDCLKNRESITNHVKQALSKIFKVLEIEIHQVEPLLNLPYRKSVENLGHLNPTCP